jgi:hypothetical protein
MFGLFIELLVVLYVYTFTLKVANIMLKICSASNILVSLTDEGGIQPT